jgi:crotonobetainyl-CoA:carnitine CoA-transferase CaiB-like acyl-CoA transferase
MNAVSGILAALLRRERGGGGALVDVSMLDGQLSLLSYHASAWLNAGKEPAAIGNAHPSIHPFKSYRTEDGWLNLAVGNDLLFDRLCTLLETDWHEGGEFGTNDARVRHREALDRLLAPRMKEASTAVWIERLSAAGIPCGPMATVPEALAQASVVEHAHPAGGEPVRTLPLGYGLDGESRASDRRAPSLGEHTEAVLSEWLAD